MISLQGNPQFISTKKYIFLVEKGIYEFERFLTLCMIGTVNLFFSFVIQVIVRDKNYRLKTRDNFFID